MQCLTIEEKSYNIKRQNEIGYDKTSNIKQSNCEKILTEKSF